jgi:hypothetical protein
VEDQSVLQQTFFTTKGKFPGLSSRLPIDVSKTVVRRFPANVYFARKLAREAFEIRTETAYLRYRQNVGLPPLEEEIASVVEETREIARNVGKDLGVGGDPAVRQAFQKRQSAIQQALEFLRPFCQARLVEEYAAILALVVDGHQR